MAASFQIDGTVLETIVTAVETVMNPLASSKSRYDANKICEEFKEHSKDSVKYGLELAHKTNSSFIRHYGLKVVEHCIKYRWHTFNDEEKAFLKCNSLKLINEGTKDLLEEDLAIKDAVSRVVVELIKREWPQCWNDLFSHFTTLCDNGDTQTEIVLMVLLRLSEDVVSFQSIPQARRKDLMQALSAAMGSIFQFFSQILFKNLEIYKCQNGLASQKSLKVCLAGLAALTGYLDWVNISHIIDNNLLPVFCTLLLDKNLGLPASECLLIFVGRKGKLSDRKPMMLLFNQEPMTVIVEAASNATDHIKESTSNVIFLKRLCEIILEIGKQLCCLWGSPDYTDEPPNFEMYLKAVLAFTQHPSQTLRHMMYSLWCTFLKHSIVSQNQVFQSILPALLQCSAVCLQKVGFPTQNNSISCEYSRLEFDSDDEFNALMINLRVMVVDSLRMMTSLSPKLTWPFACSWLVEELNKPIDIGKDADTEKGICNLSSPSFIEWDACCSFLEAVMSKIFLAEEKPNIEEGVSLLNKVLDYKNQDPIILSSVLSCVSALFPFLNYVPQMLPQVLTKIFDAVVFNLPGQTKSSRSQSVRNVRVHACSVFVKICKLYPKLLLPEFQHLCSCVNQLNSDPEQLSQMEKTILIEALIIVSNQFNNFKKQSDFLEEVLGPVQKMWMSDDFVQAFSSHEYFMSYVGLNQPAVEPSSADTCGINRSHILYCINTILAVIKRSQWPQEFTVAHKGGFVVKRETGSVFRSPAAPHVCPLLLNLITLLKTISSLWLPQCLQLRHPDFVKAYDLSDHERQNVLGIPPSCVDNSDSLVYRRPTERMQNFTSAVFEQGFHVMGNASQCLGFDFYGTPELAKVINENLIVNFKHIPDHRARSFIRNFMKQFVLWCPKEQYKNVVIPVLEVFCPEIYQRLMERWQIINQRLEEKGEDNDEDQDPESQEIVEETLMRQLTKEYIELLIQMLSKKELTSCEASEEQGMEELGESESRKSANNYRDLSESGQLIMNTPTLYPSIMMCVLTGLSWADTWVALKCGLMLWPLCKQISANKQLNSQAAQHMFMSILSALQLHGQHESCQALLLTLGATYYGSLVEEFPVLRDVLAQVPDVDFKFIKAFEETIANPPRANGEKKKKDLFKKIVFNIIGKNIGQQFRRTSQYTFLPQLFLEKRKPKNTDLLNSDDGDGIGISPPRCRSADGCRLRVCRLTK